jgi:hypothetical protein
MAAWASQMPLNVILSHAIQVSLHLLPIEGVNWYQFSIHLCYRYASNFLSHVVVPPALAQEP